ncbi:acyl-ACP--UDP-N-acetylglucosamine O-acyltransferase [Desulfomonile tiedjei]|uniref:Acyl-[acyl-carrier-protein]--UDP-N-acetylglucosamine O-acyltransferase n=1 Tax=Desulfomonile tiedjei (strain ATCC 49306 / DSM 6799 / DCB-1) TaxID=706587 RepID=I4C886_DESTA|nr:acyl-ACP--UDP-N-acetylglucosamine O-acyltransferase [Desulfomonile tiedjei]AFM25777.1 acyl-(acyl-carrier-protein)--UDP-N-acetylglucosamine O-acyltransferase [Desulfomonile tiedjei DSM 6799]
MIHSMAVVHPGAVIGDGVSIGPYTVVGPNVVIGEGCEIGPHVVVEGHTTIGPHTRISQFASIGGPPQDFSYRGEETKVKIGARVIIREYVTIHRGTVRGKGETIVGDESYLMAYCHVAHDCILGNGVVMANSAHLGGHIELGERAILGGLVAVHQFVRVGEFALVGGVSGVAKDVPPYTLASGARIYVYGLNEVGLRRNGFSPETIRHLKRAFKLAFRSSLRVEQAVEKIRAEMGHSPQALRFAEFLATSRRGTARVSLSRHAFRPV